MEGRTLAQLGAVAFVAVALTATVIELTRPETAIEVSSRPVSVSTVDPLAAELVRCQSLGEAGPRDAACRAAWTESRKRFLAPSVSRAQIETSTASEMPLRNETIVTKNLDVPVLEETAPATTQDRGP